MENCRAQAVRYGVMHGKHDIYGGCIILSLDGDDSPGRSALDVRPELVVLALDDPEQPGIVVGFAPLVVVPQIHRVETSKTGVRGMLSDDANPQRCQLCDHLGNGVLKEIGK